MAPVKNLPFLHPMKETPLKLLRKAANVSQEDVAEELGISSSQVSRYESDERDLKLSELKKLSKFLKVPIAAIAERPTVPIVGVVGAGSEMAFFAEGQPLNEFAQMPPEGTDKTVAVEIRGDSLGSALNGWVAYYDERRDPPTDDLMGTLCVVGLEDGRVLIKKLVHGRRRGSYDLWSSNSEPLLDQAVSWAARVIALLPK